MIYWIPEHTSLTPGLLERIGLSDRFGSAGVVWRHGAGPDGMAGLFCGQDAEPDRLAWRGEEVRWQAAPDGSWYVGIEGNETPDSLVRQSPLRGYPIDLADGRAWLVPVVRRADGTCGLPVPLRMGDDGQIVAELRPAHRRLVELVDTLWREFVSQADQGAQSAMTVSAAAKTAAAGIGVNYRVGIEEVMGLGLLTSGTDGNLVAVLQAMVDWPEVTRRGKELQAAESDG